MKKILAVILTVIIAVSSIAMVSAVTESRLIGDVNNDGVISVADATDIQKYLANIIDLDDEALICADTDGNGVVSISDATTTQKYLAEIIEDFPANQPDPTEPDPTEPESGNIIPEGGIYTTSSGDTLTGGDTFPDTPDTNDTYEYEDYIYTFKKTFAFGIGWSVAVKDTSKSSYSTILSEIIGKPIKGMYATFKNCTNLTTAPTIPENVKDMRYTFWSCDNLTTAPKIPNSVTDMYCTFQYCRSLTGEVEINASNLECYDYCFDGTRNPITLTGTCPILYTIASQYSNVSTSAPEPTTAPTQPTTKPTEKPTEPTTKPSTVTPNEMELEILRLVNVERTSRGIKPLKFGDFYYEAAKTRAKELDTLFSHTRPDGRSCFTALLDINVNTDFDRYMGENCARYFNDAETVVKGFMNSDGHRMNIICPDYDYLAVAVYESEKYPGYYTVEQLFLSDVVD